MAIAPVDRWTPEVVQQLNDNFNALDVAVDAVEATAADTLTKSSNLAGLANKATARDNLELGTAAVKTAGAADGVATLDANAKVAVAQLPNSAEATDALGGVIPSFETVAAMKATTIPYKRMYLEGYWERGDGGGGIVEYDAASSATPDDGLVFALDTLPGRVTRSVAGGLHSRQFGLYNDPDGADSQATRLQAFFHALNKSITLAANYVGIVDPDIIDCKGATIYLERNAAAEGTDNYQNNAQLDADSRRSSIIRNVNMVVGTARWKKFTASGNVRLENLRIEGRLHIQNVEGNSDIRNVSVVRAPMDTAASPMNPDFPTTLLGGSSDPVTGVTWKDWASTYIFTMFASNHPLITNLTLNGKAGSGIPSGDYLKGVLSQGNANPRFLMGTIFGCAPGFVINAAGDTRVHLDGLKFEECEGIHVWARAGTDHILSTWHRQGAGHNTTDPIIRLGETGVANVENVRIEKAYMFSDQAGLGTAIRCDNVTEAKVDDNHFSDFATAVDTGASNVSIGTSRTRSDIVVTKKNRFESCTTNVSRGARTQRNDTADLTPWPVVNSATTVWSGYNGLVQRLQTNASRTINVGEMANGQVYTLLLRKGALAHTIAWAGDTLLWDGGTAPDFAAMTITQHAEITVKPVDFGSGQVRGASYRIVGV